MRNLLKSFIVIFVLLALIGCNKEKEEIDEQSLLIDDIHEHLQEVVEIEKDFETTRQSLLNLEKADEEIYNDIIELDYTEHDQVIELTEEAIEMLEERFDYLREEKEIMDESASEFANIETLLNELEDESMNDQLVIVYDTMMNRYDLYNDIYEEYSYSLYLTEELYKMLQDEVHDEGEMFSLVEDINESYEKVSENLTVFNEHTTEYNEEKQQLYDLMNTYLNE